MAEIEKLKDVENMDLEALEQRLQLAKQMLCKIIDMLCKQEIKNRKKATHVIYKPVGELENVNVEDFCLETPDNQEIDGYPERLKNYIKYLDMLCRNKRSFKGKVLDQIQKKYSITK